jgi:hypothetical protein
MSIRTTTIEMRKGVFSLQKFILNNRNLPIIVINSGFKDDDGNKLENLEKTSYHVRLINSNKNLPTVVETFRRNVNTIVSNKPVMISQAGLEPKQFIPILTAYLILIN